MIIAKVIKHYVRLCRKWKIALPDLGGSRCDLFLLKVIPIWSLNICDPNKKNFQHTSIKEIFYKHYLQARPSTITSKFSLANYWRKVVCHSSKQCFTHRWGMFGHPVHTNIVRFLPWGVLQWMHLRFKPAKRTRCNAPCCRATRLVVLGRPGRGLCWQSSRWCRHQCSSIFAQICN